MMMMMMMMMMKKMRMMMKLIDVAAVFAESAEDIGIGTSYRQ